MSNEVTLLNDKIEEFNPKNFTYFVKPTYYDMSNLKLEGLKKVAEIIQWGRRNPIKFCERFFGIEFLDYQKYVFMQSWITPYVVWCMSRSAGKALDLDTRIPIPDGDKTMRDIHVGDYVFNEKGEPTRVTYESPIYYDHDCYRVVFEDGEEIIADAEHNWYMCHKDNLFSKGDVFTTKELYKDYYDSTYVGNMQYKYSVNQFLKDDYKHVINIEKVSTRPVKCIQVASDSHLYLCGNNNTITHNTTLGSPFLMAKTLLIPKFEAYILSGTGAQSIGMMKKIEQIAKKEIASFAGLTDIFANELVKSQANSNGISHDPSSWSYKLYSGSTLATINSNYDAARGHRSRLNFYDEASYVPEEMFTATEPFVTQNSDFVLGGDVDVTLLPPNFPNQMIYASSAGSMDDTFYKRYKEYSLHSLAGDKRYACFDIDCDMVMTATYNGKLYPTPLLTQEKIDSEMKINPIKANREYRNHFDTDGGENIAVKKSQVIRNSEVRPPELVNTDGATYMLAYDPAKKHDNSVVGVGKLLYDSKRGWTMQIVNCINLLDKQTHKPLTTPEQIDRVRELMVQYNGYGNPDYQNIKRFFIDAGSGGGATQILDFLFNDFYEYGHDDELDYKHKGMIDKEYPYCEPYIKRYPNAVDIISLLEPSKYKTLIYTALVEMIDQDLISFTADYDYHGYLTILSEEDTEGENYLLSPEEETALKQIDAMKEEVTHMYKYKSSNGNIRYDLAPGFEHMIGDDRAYVLALLGWGLYRLRSEDMTRRQPKDNTNALIDKLSSKIRMSDRQKERRRDRATY